MAIDHLDLLFFIHRPNISQQELPSIFGRWCQHYAADRGFTAPHPSETYESVYDAIMSDAEFPHKDSPVLDVLARIVAFMQPKRSAKRHAIYTQSTSRPDMLCLAPEDILAIEAYIYAYNWPRRLAIIISNHSVHRAPPAPYPSTILAWLSRVAQSGIHHRSIESTQLALYCAFATPMHIAIRQRPTEKDPYIWFLTWNTQFPQPHFDDTVAASAMTTPLDITTEPHLYTNNHLLFMCACVSILQVFINITMTSRNALVWPPNISGKKYTLTSHTAANAHPDTWCTLFSLYLAEDTAYIRLPDNTIVIPHTSTPDSDPHCAGTDVVFAYIYAIAPYFPNNAILQEIWANFNRPVDTVPRPDDVYLAYT